MATTKAVPDSTRHLSLDSLRELTAGKTAKSETSRSVPSGSRASHISSSSSVRLQQRIAAKTARKRLEFLEEESNLLEQKADYEANALIQKAKLDVEGKRLSARKEAAITMAQLKAVEEEVFDSEHSSVIDNDEHVAQERTEQYVNFQNGLLNAHAPPFIPSHEGKLQKLPDHRQESPTLGVFNNELTNNNAQCTDLTKFLVKKDLLTERFHKFDDKAEHYVSWKYTFKSIVTEIQTTPAEEIDLLLRWTGDESLKQVQSIKVANAGRPVVGLVRVWKR